MTGHYVRVQPSGAKTYTAVARSPAGKQTWVAIGAADVMTIGEAREAARELVKRIRAGLPAVEVKPDSVADVTTNWLVRHVRAKGVRTAPEIERLINKHILPAWRDRELVSIKKSDIAKLLDKIEDENGARTADRVLGIVGAIMNWHMTRSDHYSPPTVRGMRRQSTTEQARERILDDDEIRNVWKAAEGVGTFGAIVKLLLLTGQRLAKVSGMRWQDLESGVWSIPRAPREKDNAGELVLPAVAVEIIQPQPRLGPYVFSGRRGVPFHGFSSSKRRFDAKLPADMPNWTLHDLRRTSRSLMSRAGVRPDIAERVLGHSVGGVHRTYDRHEYRDEKADALARLAAVVRDILNPPPVNVVPIKLGNQK